MGCVKIMLKKNFAQSLNLFGHESEHVHVIEQAMVLLRSVVQPIPENGVALFVGHIENNIQNFVFYPMIKLETSLYVLDVKFHIPAALQIENITAVVTSIPEDVPKTISEINTGDT
jgi:hypothetical protein